MKFDIILSGIAGQGVRTMGSILARAASRAGLQTLRSALHPVHARGGAVIQHLRIADHVIEGSQIEHAEAELILSLEPLEGLRALDFLSTAGALITASEPVSNISSYPPLEELHWSVLELRNGFVVHAHALARTAGSERVENVVLLGAACDFLPMDADEIRAGILDVLASKGDAILDINFAAFEAGRSALRHREVVDEFDTFAGLRR